MATRIIVNIRHISSEEVKSLCLPTTVFVGEQVVDGSPISYIWECPNYETAVQQVEHLYDNAVGAVITTNDEEELQILLQFETLALS